MQEGIYFHLPENDYHAINALSCSGIKALTVSGLRYWQEFLNPQGKRKQSRAMDFGKAAHKFNLEPAEFLNEYAIELEKPADALDTIEDLKAYLASNGVEFNKTGTKQSYIDLVKTLPAHPPIWQDMQKAYFATLGNKTIIKQADYDLIVAAYETRQEYATLKDIFTGGYPEVSIVIKVRGVLMKMRIDYMRVDEDIDYKTFTNAKRKPFKKAISDAILYEKYWLQYFMYSQAMLEAIERLKKGTLAIVGEVAPEFIEQLKRQEKRKFSLLFQEADAPHECLKVNLSKEVAHNATPNEYHNTARYVYKQAFDLYATMAQKYGTDGTKKWIDTLEELDFTDEDIPTIIYQAY